MPRVRREALKLWFLFFVPIVLGIAAICFTATHPRPKTQPHHRELPDKTHRELDEL